MAKRVSPQEKGWNPVEASLVGDVFNPQEQATIQTEGSPALSTSRAVSIDAHRDQSKATREADPEEEPKEVEKLSREKRVLLTESEEDTLERLVKDISKKLGTSVKLSHVLRATVSLLMHSQDEILKQSQKMGRLKRPPNNDSAALAVFEHNLARIVDRAIRGSRIMD